MPKSITFTRPLSVDHQVGGLQIAVDDPGAMRVAERVEHLRAQRGGAVEWQRTEPIRDAIERLAPDELHHHQQIVVVLRELVERRDVRDD